MTALQVDAVLACVKIICSGVSTLPLNVFEHQVKDGRNAKRKAFDHPLFSILRGAPNPEMTSHTFRIVEQCHALLWGNAYAEIQRNNAAEPVAFWPRNPARTRPVRLTCDARIEGTLYPRGTLIYHTSETIGDEPSFQDDQQNRMAPERIILAEDMLHVVGLSLDGRLGQSTVYLARQIMGLALGSEKYAAKFFGNGAIPQGVLTTPGTLEPKAVETLKRSWAEAYGGENTHKTAILEQGLDYKQIGVEPEKTQLLETRHFQRAAIASIFQVPLHMLGEKEAAKSSVEQTSIEFYNYCLSPWLDSWEQEFKRKLFPPEKKAVASFFVKFDIQRLLYPDAASRSKFYTDGKNTGWLNSNDIREMEDLNPIEDGSGDVYWMPVNMQDAANPLTAPHIGGKQNMATPGISPEKPQGGAPQNLDKLLPKAIPQAAPAKRSIDASAPEQEVVNGIWTVSLYKDDSTWHVLIFGNGEIAHVYHGPDEDMARKVYAQYGSMSADAVGTVMSEHLSGDKQALVKKAGTRSLDGLVTRYMRVYYPLFKDAAGRVKTRKEVDETIFNRCFKPALRGMIEALSLELADSSDTVVAAEKFDEQADAFLEGMRFNLQGVSAGDSDAYAMRETRRAAETFADIVARRYAPGEGTGKPFYVGRHGTTDDDVQGKWTGWDDLGLNQQGVAEAEATAETLKGLGIKLVVSSALPRSIETARVYATALGVPLETDADLNALDLGIFAGMNEEANAARLELYIKSPDTVIPDGESISAYTARVNGAIDRWEGKNDQLGPILVVTHSSGIATYLGKLEHGDDKEDLENCSEKLTPAGVVEIEDGGEVEVITGTLQHGDAA